MDDRKRVTAGGDDGQSDAVRFQRTSSTRPNAAQPFGWRDWMLVATLVVSLILIPGALLVLPAAQDLVASLGLSLRDAYLTLPLIPAFLLGAVAVWSALQSRDH